LIVEAIDASQQVLFYLIKATFMLCKSVLVIDDDDNVRNTLAAILSQSGYRVVTAGFVCDAIESLITNCIDLVVLDMKMPDMEGQALLSQLHLVYPKLPVMVLTGHPSMGFVDGAERFGTRGYFLKPVDPALLLDCVKEILSEPGALH
jgi:DNA-binding NtrC family response regulator